MSFFHSYNPKCHHHYNECNKKHPRPKYYALHYLSPSSTSSKGVLNIKKYIVIHVTAFTAKIIYRKVICILPFVKVHIFYSFWIFSSSRSEEHTSELQSRF